MDIINDLAQGILRAKARKERFHPIEVAGKRIGAEMAYAVQDNLVRGWTGGRAAAVAGYKVGLTSPAMQAMCGISSPIYGRILRDTVLPSGAEVPLAAHGRLGIEFEIAVRLNQDIDAGGAHARTLSGLGRLVDAICPALELIDDRDADYQCLDGPSIVANNSWNAGVVLGTWQKLPADLAQRGGRTYRDGAHVSQGRVGDALGNPLESVRWLLAELAGHGISLPAGSIIMTGSIVQTCFPEHRENWRFEVDGMGDVAMRAAA